MDNNLTEGQIRRRKYKASYDAYKQKHKKEINLWTKKYQRLIGRNRKYFGGLRFRVLTRDKYTCVICGMTNNEHRILWNRQLTIDHIDGNGRNSVKPNNIMENLRTLCLRCHGSIDRKRRKYWPKYHKKTGRVNLGEGIR